MKQRLLTVLLLCVMLATLALSGQTAEAVRQGLQLCASSVIPALFPFFVLSSLFTALGGADVPGQTLGGVIPRLLGCSGTGASVFFLGILGGYPLGARMIGELFHAKRLSRQEAQHLLCFCNNAGPAFILGIAGLGCFGSIRLGIWLYLIHVAAAALLGILLRRKGTMTESVSAGAEMTSFPAALVDAIAAAGSSMVQICAFVVFFVTLLQLFSSLTGISHPLALGAVELTNGIVRLGSSRGEFLIASFLLGWGGVSVHCQTAAVLHGTGVNFAHYLCAKGAHAFLSLGIALPVSRFFFPA